MSGAKEFDWSFNDNGSVQNVGDEVRFDSGKSKIYLADVSRRGQFYLHYSLFKLNGFRWIGSEIAAIREKCPKMIVDVYETNLHFIRTSESAAQTVKLIELFFYFKLLFWHFYFLKKWFHIRMSVVGGCYFVLFIVIVEGCFCRIFLAYEYLWKSNK